MGAAVPGGVAGMAVRGVGMWVLRCVRGERSAGTVAMGNVVTISVLKPPSCFGKAVVDGHKLLC